MRTALIALAVLAAACGPQRCPDPMTCFDTITQFSAVKKILVEGNYVYTAEPGGFERISTTADGGMLETLLADSTVHDFAVTVKDGFVATDTGLVRVDIAGPGANQQLSTEKVTAVAADQYGVSWISCPTLHHASADGSNHVSTTLLSCDPEAATLAIDSSTAYGSSGNTDWFASRSGGSPVEFGSVPCTKVAAGGGWLYCASTGLKRLAPLSPTPENLLDGDVHDFAIGAENLYVSVNAELDSMPRNGGTPTALGVSANITAIAVDTKVYFVNSSMGLGRLLSTAL